MTDKKISQLSNAATPVAGTEVLPIVQSGATVKVSIDNLTKGKTVPAATFDTDVAAAKVTLSGTTLAAAGTDANIDVNITPKGAGATKTTKLSASGDVSFDGGTFVFNESGADKDFRVEGDTEPNALFVDASADSVGLGTATPEARLALKSTRKQDGSAGSSFNVYFPITSILCKFADAADLGSASSNGNAELTLAAGTDIDLTPLGALGIYAGTNDEFVTAVGSLGPSGYSVAARVVVVGDGDTTSDSPNIKILARSSADNGGTWYDFDLATGYTHQAYGNTRYLMFGKWMPVNTTNLPLAAGGGIMCKFGVRAASSYALVYSSISVQIAYVKLP